jgi:hypothetical protein
MQSASESLSVDGDLHGEECDDVSVWRWIEGGPVPVKAGGFVKRRT